MVQSSSVSFVCHSTTAYLMAKLDNNSNIVFAIAHGHDGCSAVQVPFYAFLLKSFQDFDLWLLLTLCPSSLPKRYSLGQEMYLSPLATTTFQFLIKA